MDSTSSPGRLQQFSEKTAYFIGILVSLVHIYFNIFTVLPTLTQNALHYSGFAILCGLMYPLSRSSQKERSTVELGLSLAFGTCAAFCTGSRPMQTTFRRRESRFSYADSTAGRPWIIARWANYPMSTTSST